MQTNRHRLGLSFVVLILWIAITSFGGILLAGTGRPLTDLVMHGIGFQFAAAVLFLFAVVVLFAWSDVGLRPPSPVSSLRLLWLPGLYIAGLGAMVFSIGLPPARVMVFVFLNTLLVGISEELMFRGILFHALERRLPIWPAILITTAVFGGIHVLNGFQTGVFTAAILQAVAASFSGLMFLAIRIRTGSLYPAIALHTVWNFMIFLVVIGSGADRAEVSSIGLSTLVIPVLLILPELLYAFYLLRNVSRQV